MDLLALTLIAASILALFGAILAGFIFAPWVMVFAALGLLVLLPRTSYTSEARSLSSATSALVTKIDPQPDTPAAPESAAEQSAHAQELATDAPSMTLQYRGNFYRSAAVPTKAGTVAETVSRDR